MVVFFNIDFGGSDFSFSWETRSIIFLKSAGDLATGVYFFTGIYSNAIEATYENLSIRACCSRVSYLAFDFLSLVWKSSSESLSLSIPFTSSTNYYSSFSSLISNIPSLVHLLVVSGSSENSSPNTDCRLFSRSIRNFRASSYV